MRDPGLRPFLPSLRVLLAVAMGMEALCVAPAAGQVFRAERFKPPARSSGEKKDAELPWEEGTVRLRWRNGDMLAGQLLTSPEEGLVHFASPLFTRALDLDPAQLSGVRFPPSAAGGRGEAEKDGNPSFELFLKNGDRLRGQLLAADERQLTFQAPPFAEPIPIAREAILRLVQANEQGGFSGLGDPEDWISLGRDRKPTDWFADLKGELATHQWNGNLFREIDLPERVEIRFRARFPEGKPSFELGLLRDPKRGPMLETWDGYLVLTHRTRFAPVRLMAESTRELHLRLFWDQKSGDLRLCDASGVLLARLQGETEAPSEDPRRQRTDPLRRGFSILSRNPEMKLVSLEVREWDGKEVPIVDPKEPRLQLRQGPLPLTGEAIELKPGESTLRIGDRRLALRDIVEWVIAPDLESEGSPPVSAVPENATRIAWNSGSTLSGRFHRFRGDGIVFQPPWSDRPILASLQGAREIRFPAADPAVGSGSDRLTRENIRLRGTLRFSPEGGSFLAWQPPGARQAVPLAEGAGVDIVRDATPDRESASVFPLQQTRVHLADEEILVGDLISLDAERLVFESRITGRLEIPATQVRALDLGSSNRLLEGFRDPEWERVEGDEESVIFDADKVTLRSGSFGNPSILLGDRVRFDLEWQESYAAITVRLFASGADPSAPSSDLVFAIQGNRLFAGKLNANGAFSFSGDQIPVTGNRVSLELSLQAGEVGIRVNGRFALSLPLDLGYLSGNGLYFRLGGGWQGWNQMQAPIVLSHFQIASSPGHIPQRIVDPRAKIQVLTIPRVDREAPPTHLLVAPNGDLLRGRLQGIDKRLVTMQAHGATLAIPRARVASLVRLEPPLLESPPTEPPSRLEPVDDSEDSEIKVSDNDDLRRQRLASYQFQASHRFILRDGSRLRLKGQGLNNAQFVGESPVLGSCRISLDQIREVSHLGLMPLEEAPLMDYVAYADWQPRLAPDPAIPDPDGPPTSPLVGKEAPDFELSLLDDSTFQLSKHLGKVVVLDFWATWSGPCIKAMPEVMDAIQAFPEEAVTFLAINQGETPPLVSEFLEAREWQDTPVAIDFNLKVGQSYQVESLPYTVVIDPAGKIAWVHSGAAADIKEKLFGAIVRLLSRP